MDSSFLLSDHLLEALAALNRAREEARRDQHKHHDAVVREITQAELSIARVLGLIAGAPS